jgi:hypothetical protein
MKTAVRVPNHAHDERVSSPKLLRRNGLNQAFTTPVILPVNIGQDVSAGKSSDALLVSSDESSPQMPLSPRARTKWRAWACQRNSATNYAEFRYARLFNHSILKLPNEVQEAIARYVAR